jgi:hypothetical protein
MARSRKKALGPAAAAAKAKAKAKAKASSSIVLPGIHPSALSCQMARTHEAQTPTLSTLPTVAASHAFPTTTERAAPMGHSSASQTAGESGLCFGPPGVPYCATKLCCACGKVAFSDFAAFRYVICVAAVASILC